MSENQRFIVGLILAALVSYFSAQVTVQTRVAVIETRQQLNHEDVIRRQAETDAKADRIDTKVEKLLDLLLKK